MSSDALLQSYLAAEYHIDTDKGPLVLRIGQDNPALDQLLEQHNVRSACFMTAYNPRSQPVAEHLNREEQAKLAQQLLQLSVRVLTGAGVDPKGLWPPEPSLVALNLAPPLAHELAQRFQQNAYVWIEQGQPPRLIWA